MPAIGRLTVLPVTLLLLAACGGGRGSRSDSESRTVRLLPIASPAHHDVRIEVDLHGWPGESTGIHLEVSTDGGESFRPIVVSPGGPYFLNRRHQTMSLVWDSLSALGTGRHEVLIRQGSGRGSPQAVTIANYGYATAADLEDWAARGADGEELLLADAWSVENWAAGHLEGAVAVPIDRILEFGERVLPSTLDRPLVFYCGGGT